METLSLPEIKVLDRQSERKANRFRQAAARRKLQELRDEEALRNWLTEVWDENPSLIETQVRQSFSLRNLTGDKPCTDQALIKAGVQH